MTQLLRNMLLPLQDATDRRLLERFGRLSDRNEPVRSNQLINWLDQQSLRGEVLVVTPFLIDLLMESVGIAPESTNTHNGHRDLRQRPCVNCRHNEDNDRLSWHSSSRSSRESRDFDGDQSDRGSIDSSKSGSRRHSDEDRIWLKQVNSVKLECKPGYVFRKGYIDSKGRRVQPKCVKASLRHSKIKLASDSGDSNDMSRSYPDISHNNLNEQSISEGEQLSTRQNDSNWWTT